MKILSARISLGAFVCIAFCGSVQPAHSAPITYTLSGVGSGSLGGVSFSNSAFTITAFADTSDVTHFLAPVFRVTNSATTISISGVGSGTLLTNSVTLDFQNPNPSEASAGIFLYYQGPRLLSVFNSAFQTYELNTSFASHSGNSGIQPAFIFPTTAGDFSLSAVSSASFAASVVPEPPASILLSIPAILVCAFWSKRSRTPPIL